MSPYQQKWIDVLNGASLKDWKIEAVGNEIHVEMPHVTDLKIVRDNIPQTLAAIALDITEPKERLKFHFHNGYEHFDYVINPQEDDLGEA